MRASLVMRLGLLILTIALPAQSKDSSFRCGNTFIDVGDSRARVLHHCGEPYRREVIGYVRSAENEELIEMVEEKEMPLPSYTWTHSQAKLSDDQTKAVLDWAKQVRIKYSLAPKPI